MITAEDDVETILLSVIVNHSNNTIKLLGSVNGGEHDVLISVSPLQEESLFSVTSGGKVRRAEFNGALLYKAIHTLIPASKSLAKEIVDMEDCVRDDS
jgi:hypothetical protein